MNMEEWDNGGWKNTWVDCKYNLEVIGCKHEDHPEINEFGFGICRYNNGCPFRMTGVFKHGVA